MNIAKIINKQKNQQNIPTLTKNQLNENDIVRINTFKSLLEVFDEYKNEKKDVNALDLAY